MEKPVFKAAQVSHETEGLTSYTRESYDHQLLAGVPSSKGLSNQSYLKAVLA